MSFYSKVYLFFAKVYSKCLTIDVYIEFLYDERTIKSWKNKKTNGFKNFRGYR